MSLHIAHGIFFYHAHFFNFSLFILEIAGESAAALHVEMCRRWEPHATGKNCLKIS